MIRATTFIRSLLLVLVAIAISGLTLRAQLSSAVVSRGDELAFRSGPQAALEMYARAIAFDRENGVAVDRFAFASMVTHQPVRLREAVAVSSRFLHDRPYDLVVRFDRALCLERLRQFSAAENDFRVVGERARDAQALTFAGLLDLRLQRRDVALVLLREALRDDRTFIPALRALQRARRTA